MGAWNKESAKVTNDVRKLQTIANDDSASMKVLIDSITVELNPNDNSAGFQIYGFDHDSDPSTPQKAVVATALFEPQFKHTYMPYSDFQ